MKAAIKIWLKVFSVLRKHPVVLIPFVVTAVFLFGILYLLYLAPQNPVSLILAPPIRAFFGEKFLHYPSSIFLLPKLFYYAQLALGATVGVVMAGTAIGMLKNNNRGEAPRGLVQFIDSIRKYFVLLGIWLVMFGVSFLFGKLIRGIFSGAPHQLLITLLAYIVALFIQILFIYCMPIALVERKGLFGALGGGILFFKRVFLTSLILTMAPGLLYLPIIVLNHQLPKLIKVFSPEVIILFLIVSILVIFIMEVLIICSTTLLFLDKSGNKPNK